MRKRPLSITFLGWLFIAVGSIALVYHLSEFDTQHPLRTELLWVCLVRLLVIIGGVCLLRGFTWARWLLVAWMAYHIVLSLFHSAGEAVMHVLLFGVIGFFLLRRPASVYFGSKRPEPPATPAPTPPTSAR